MSKTVRIFSTIALICVLGITFGCVNKSDFETLQMQRAQDLNRIKQLEAELDETKQLLSQQIETSQTPVRQKTADIWAEMQTMRKDLALLRGELDNMTLRMDRQVGTSESTTTLMDLERSIAELEFIMENQLQVDLEQARAENGSVTSPTAAPVETSEVAPAPEAAVAETTTTTPAPTPPPSPDTDPAKALYDKAYALYKEGQYEKARSYWAEFTDTFKGHPFTPSAVFWQGQCYYKLKDYARAAILFEDVIEKHKKSSKYKTALLKAGYSWNYLGKPELAKMRMDEIVKNYPKSAEATQAKRFLSKAK